MIQFESDLVPFFVGTLVFFGFLMLLFFDVVMGTVSFYQVLFMNIDVS